MALAAQALVNGLLQGSLYALIGAGLCLILGVMKTVNFAHGELLMLGAFATYYLCTQAGLPFIVAFVLTIGLLFAFGFGLEKVLFRPIRGDMLAGFILTLGLSMVLSHLGLRIFGTIIKGLPSTMPGVFKHGVLTIPNDKILTSLLALAVMGVLSYILYRTKLGLGFRAVSQDPEAAMLQGINIGHVSSLSFAVSAAMAGAAGSLYGALFAIDRKSVV